MRESLGKVSQRAPRVRFDLLREEADIVAVRAHALERVPRVVERSAAKGQILRTPEAADSERAFARRVGRAIPIQQAATGAEMLLDARVGLAHSRGSCWFESVPGNEEEAGVETIAVELRHVALQRRIPGARLDLPADRFAVLRELRRRR